MNELIVQIFVAGALMKVEVVERRLARRCATLAHTLLQHEAALTFLDACEARAFTSLGVN